MTPEEKLAYDKKKERQEARKKLQAEKSGTPMKDYGFWKWTDITTSRTKTIYENLFGETIQFHRQHFLEDTLVFRPVFVKYDWLWSYVVEGIILLLFAIGIWCGRKSRFLWMALSYFGFDMCIHLILGFGINEIFIWHPIGSLWFLWLSPLPSNMPKRISTNSYNYQCLHSLVISGFIMVSCLCNSSIRPFVLSCKNRQYELPGYYTSGDCPCDGLLCGFYRKWYHQ